MAVRRTRGERDSALGNGASPGFASLLNRLVGDVFRLLDQKLALIRLELREEFAALARRSALLAVGAVVIVFGLVLLVVALALWLGELVGSTPGGFAIVGGLAVAGGAVLLSAMRRRLAAQRMVPEQTVQELKRDIQWIKHEL